MDRKNFLKVCGYGCVSIPLLGIFLNGCTNAVHYAQSTDNAGKLVVKKTEFIQVGKEKTTQRKYVLAKSDKYNFPICIYKIDEQTYSALLMECTHNSCELQPHGEYLICPCHGSEFNNKGMVQNPPAEQHLKSFKTTSDNEHIYIQI